jgi:hypothetical protein
MNVSSFKVLVIRILNSLTDMRIKTDAIFLGVTVARARNLVCFMLYDPFHKSKKSYSFDKNRIPPL